MQPGAPTSHRWRGAGAPNGKIDSDNLDSPKGQPYIPGTELALTGREC